MKKIPLRNTMREVVAHALVDDEDFDRVISKGSWHRDGNYVAHNHQGVNHRLHRFVMRFGPEDPKVDHVNGNGLDNQKSNLRSVTDVENGQNRSPAGNSNNKSGYRGVSWDKWTQKWVGRFKVDGKQYNVGRFSDVHEAGRAVADARTRMMTHTVEERRGLH